MKSVRIGNIKWITGFFLAVSFGVALGASNEKVLYLGDSLSMGSFGRTFDSTLRSRQLEVYTHVAGGASPYYWLSRYEPISCSIGYWEKTPERERRVGYVREVPKIEKLLESYSPDIVVIQTGVNLYATLRSKRRTGEENVKIVEGLIADMCQAVRGKGAEQYWITPPESHPDRYPETLQSKLTEIMKRTVGRHGGFVFESSKVTQWTAPYPRGSDGIHYGPMEAKAWAEKAAGHFLKTVEEYEKMAARKKTLVASGPLKASPIQATPLPGAQLEDPPAAPDPPKVKESEAMAKSTGPEGVGELEKKADRPPRKEFFKDPDDEVQVKLVLRGKSSPEHVNEISYNRAFGLFEYEVLSVEGGHYPFDRIRVAHMIYMNSRFTSPSRFDIGKEIELELVKLEKYPRLQTVQMIDKLPPDFDLPVYICKF